MEKEAENKNFDEQRRDLTETDFYEVHQQQDIRFSSNITSIQKKNQKRSLVSVDPTQCVVSGDGLGPSIEALKTYTINLVAKDSSGNNIGVGGESFKIEITNKWTISGVLSWEVDASAKKPLSAPISGTMTDNGDGTYTFNYMVNQSGEITVFIVLQTSGAYGEFRPTFEITGSVVSSNMSSRLYFEAYELSINGQTEYISSVFTTSLLAPATGNYYFQFDHDDGLKIQFEGDIKYDTLGVIAAASTNFVASMVAGQYYYLKIWLQNALGPGLIQTYWTVPGSTYIDIPSSNYYYRRHVGSTPYQVSVSCPSGYSGTNVASPYICKEICGDGLRVGSEIWDDGNTNDNDGWSSNWGLVETGFVCSGGSIASGDSWVPCVTGFIPSGTPTPSVCVEVWGDGLRVGVEIWDDSNISDGDGWSSDWRSTESGYICTGGSSTSADTCTKWADGYYPNSNTPPDEWNTKWGDGKKVLGVEWWEDGNSVNGDGWSSIWEQENDWAWLGGDINHTDIWIKWKAGYTATQNHELWFDTPLPRTAEIMRALAAFSAFAGVSMSSMTALTSSSSSSSSSFGMVNQLQMIILLPLLDTFIPQKIMDFIKAMSDSLFKMEFLPTDDSAFLDSVNEKFDFFQYNLYLYVIGLESGSAVVNVINLLIVTFMILVVHSMLSLIYLAMTKVWKLLKLLSYLRKLLSMMTFGFYVTFLNEVYLLVVIVVIYEISNSDSSTRQKSDSLLMSRIILSLVCCYLVLIVWQWTKSFSPTRFKKLRYFKALFEGLRENKWARVFPLLSLLKKMLFWIVVFRFAEWDFDDKIGFFLGVELTYFVLVSILRPYESKVDMFIEFMNEVFYVYFIAYLWAYKTEASWGTSSTDAFFWMMIANNALIVIISNCVQIVSIVRIIKRKWFSKKNKVDEKCKEEIKKDTQDKTRKTLNTENEEAKTPPRSPNLVDQHGLNSFSNLEPSQRIIFKEKYEKSLKMEDFESSHQENGKIDPSINIFYSDKGNWKTKDINIKIKYFDQVSYVDNPEHVKSL
jgi:cysteine-rich repeat protein